MSNAHQVTKDFEAALCEYTGAPYAVAVSSCTAALTLAVGWGLKTPRHVSIGNFCDDNSRVMVVNNTVSSPKCTYVSVPQAIIHAGGRPVFRDEKWRGWYQLEPLDVWDCARLFTSGMYRSTSSYRGHMQCVSFHASKILGDTQGGAILHDNAEADAWFRRARFDGRAEGVAPKDDKGIILGWHCYLSPDVSARLLMKLTAANFPRHHEPLPNDAYPDLSLLECFK